MSADTQTATIAPARPLPAVAPVSPAPAPAAGAPPGPATGGAVRWLRRHAVHLIAAAAVVATYAVAQLPSTSSAEQAAIAARFRFTPISIELPAGLPQQSIRQVNPAYERIQAWISSVGAAVALTDLDGDGLANDMCYVDPRVDRAIVAPAPVGAPRYPAFAVDTAGLAAGPAIAPMGCLPGDYNDDGRTDLLVYYWGRTPTLHLATAAAGAAPRADGFRATELIPGSTQRWFTNAATQADLDGDGRLDLVLGNYFPDDSRVLDAAASPADVTMQHSMSRALNGGRDHLLLRTGGAGAVGFRDASDALPRDVAEGWTLAVGAADLDGDQLPELYLAQDFGSDRLLHNRSTPGQLRFATLRGERGLATPGSKVLGRDSFKGMGVDFADLNGDGRLDMFVSNITEEFALQESNFVWVSTGETARMARGVAPYVERSEELGLSRTGWGWDTRLVDLDNDGVAEALQAVGFVAGRVNRWPEVQELALGNDELLAHPGAWPALRHRLALREQDDPVALAAQKSHRSQIDPAFDFLAVGITPLGLFGARVEEAAQRGRRHGQNLIAATLFRHRDAALEKLQYAFTLARLARIRDQDADLIERHERR